MTICVTTCVCIFRVYRTNGRTQCESLGYIWLYLYHTNSQVFRKRKKYFEPKEEQWHTYLNTDILLFSHLKFYLYLINTVLFALYLSSTLFLSSKYPFIESPLIKLSYQIFTIKTYFLSSFLYVLLSMYVQQRVIYLSKYLNQGRGRDVCESIFN